MKAKCSYCGEEFKPNKQQRGNITKGHNVYCKGGNCYYKASIGRIRNYRIKKTPKLVLCGYRECNNTFLSATYKYCPGERCAYLETLARQRDQSKKKRVKPVKTRSGRKCKICGQDPYPNHYFCRGCHSKVGDNDIQNEHSIGAWA